MVIFNCLLDFEQTVTILTALKLFDVPYPQHTAHVINQVTVNNCNIIASC